MHKKSKNLKDYDVRVLKQFCIYLLIKDWKVVYVGQSSCCGIERIAFHMRTKYIDFDSYTIINCKKEELNDLEAEYIMLFSPTLNKTLPKNKRYKAKKTTMVKMGIYSEPLFEDFLKANKIDTLNGRYVDLNKIRCFTKPGTV